MAGELAAFLTAWCEKRDVPIPEREADGRCFVVFDGLYEVALSQVGGTILIEAELAPVPKRRDAAEALLTKLMRMQLARAPQSAAALGLTDDNRLVLAETVAAARLEPRAMDARLGRFVNALAVMCSLISSEHMPPRSAPPLAAQVFFP